MSQRLAIIWTHFGPYHLARIRAIEPFFEVKAIELASDQRLYRWARGHQDRSYFTLTSGDWEDQNRLQVARKLWHMLDQLHPSTILVPGYSSLPALSAAVWGRIHGAKTVLMSESNFDDHRRKTLSEGVKRAIIKLFFNSGIVGGKRAASYLRRLGMPEHRIADGYDVVDNEYFYSRAAQCRLEAHDNPQSPYFLFVGRLAPEKNIFTLVKAHRQYTQAGGNWPLVIVGDGPLRDDLHRHARSEVEQGTVVFAGQKAVHELPQFYAFAGCFILPSSTEPWGLVVNEAMASGLPVIVSSRCGCADDLVYDGSNGFLIDPFDATSLAAAMIRMWQLTVEDRREMGERSLKLISTYSLERWANEVQRIVRVVGKGPRRNES